MLEGGNVEMWSGVLYVFAFEFAVVKERKGREGIWMWEEELNCLLWLHTCMHTCIVMILPQIIYIYIYAYAQMIEKDIHYGVFN